MAEKQSEQARGYLILYNFIMFLGWSCILFVSAMHLIVKCSYKGLWEGMAVPVYVFQTGAVLEVVHAAVGLVRSNPVLTAFQVTSRLIIVWLVLYSVPQVHNQIGIPLVLIAWGITEVVRYLFYTYNLIEFNPDFLVWCRYTLFIVLYPIGVTGELLSAYAALPYIKKLGLYSLRLPNKINFSFDFYYALIVIMLLYIPIFPQLYGHMFAQRRKVLGKKVKFE